MLIDYAALGFRLTVADAALALEATTEQVLDFVLLGELTALTRADPEGTRTSRLRLHADEVAAFAQRRRTGATPVDLRNAERVTHVLREYLAARPALDSAREALTQGHPMRGAARRQDDPDPVYVKPEAIAEFHRRARPGEFPLPPSMVGRVLENLGAVRARGVTPKAAKGTGKQSWTYWYRLPLVLARPFREQDLVTGLLSRSVDPEERVRVVGGEPVLADPIVPAAPDLPPTSEGFQLPADYDPGEDYQGDFDDDDL